MKRLGYLVLCGLLCGCYGLGGGKSRPAHFFVLGDGPALGRGRLFEPECVVALERVAIPRFLDQVRLVTRDRGGQLVRHEFLRWGENLSDGIGALLRKELEEGLQQDLILLAPWGGDLRPDYRLAIGVDDFTAHGDQIHLRVRCEYWNHGANRLIGVRSYGSALPWPGESADVLVAGMRRLLVGFAETIVADLVRIRNGVRPIAEEGERCRPAAELSQVPLPAPREPEPSFPGRGAIALQASAEVYATVDAAAGGERLFSGRLRPGQRITLPCPGPARVHASDPDALRVDGRPLVEWEKLLASLP
ncbi:MAG: PqiC family protein [Puniceicoccales bacterium]|jgi:uncharacterized lipoprotein YmbA|nr:PqiC family protein [Puniceicoccales bacterium]